MHADAPEALPYDPAMQSRHTCASLDGVYLPAGHSVQLITDAIAVMLFAKPSEYCSVTSDCVLFSWPVATTMLASMKLYGGSKSKPRTSIFAFRASKASSEK